MDAQNQPAQRRALLQECIPRSKPTKSYLQRKIEQYELEAWGPEKRELDLVPHIGRLEKELRKLKDRTMKGFNMDEELEVKKVVDDMFRSILQQQCPFGEDSKVHKSKLEKEQEQFWNSLRQHGNTDELENQYSSRLNKNLDQWQGAGLGDILRVHKSNLQREQEEFKKLQEEYESQQVQEMDIDEQPILAQKSQSQFYQQQDNQQQPSLSSDNQQKTSVGMSQATISKSKSDRYSDRSPTDSETMEDMQYEYVENKQPTQEVTQGLDGVIQQDSNINRTPEKNCTKRKRNSLTPKKVKKMMSPVDEALAELTKMQARTMEQSNRNRSPHKSQ
eukprot:TRINITY_DN15562_c0_g1_i6.p2 TRINITY_DN15562_c0_g1~~TRINITY_DN15562_c0_g1_i6.p2  ORF type:complete len:359 (-),score=30.16 TRINITY_DN15562_c0_g1_i6:417-1415(-)